MKNVAKALVLTAELFGVQMSPQRIEMMLSDLKDYDENELIESLAKCRKESRFMPSIAEIISRLPNQHPDADEAWSIAPKDEGATGVVTDEIMEAWGVAMSLYDDGDKVAARMAFKAAYERAVSSSMAASKRPKWWVSMGGSVHGRTGVLFDAVMKGRISPERAADLLPQHMRDEILTLPTPNRLGSHKMLGEG